MDRIKKNKCLMGGSPYINITEKEGEVMSAVMDQVNGPFPNARSGNGNCPIHQAGWSIGRPRVHDPPKIGGVLCSKQGNQFNMIGLRL